MNAERLKILSAHLRAVAPNKFDLNWWSYGATACAVGYACTIPQFKMLGLKLVLISNKAIPHLGELFGWDAVERFFSLSSGTARHLFAPEAYFSTPKPVDVADRIDQQITLQVSLANSHAGQI